MLKKFIQYLLRPCGYELIKHGSVQKKFPIHNPLDQNGIEILEDRDFIASCIEVKPYTLLDTPRLANLWSLVKLTDETGAIFEIGTYKGGGAKHLSNAQVNRKIIICDPFDDLSFEVCDPKLDSNFFAGQFSQNSYEKVCELFDDRDATIIKGYFPNAARDVPLPKISFVHLDVDVYQATLDSLLYLCSENMLLEKHIILLDDYNRNCEGVNKAVKDFLAQHPNYLALPLFPSQCLLLPKQMEN